jgi:hypothetical protein
MVRQQRVKPRWTTRSWNSWSRVPSFGPINCFFPSSSSAKSHRMRFPDHLYEYGSNIRNKKRNPLASAKHPGLYGYMACVHTPKEDRVQGEKEGDMYLSRLSHRPLCRPLQLVFVCTAWRGHLHIAATTCQPTEWSIFFLRRQAAKSV